MASTDKVSTLLCHISFAHNWKQAYIVKVANVVTLPQILFRSKNMSQRWKKKKKKKILCNLVTRTLKKKKLLFFFFFNRCRQEATRMMDSDIYIGAKDYKVQLHKKRMGK